MPQPADPGPGLSVFFPAYWEHMAHSVEDGLPAAEGTT
jgi:hypothetical protein